eukprot:3230985-Pyramimonas_sp.AAC.1
MRAGAYQLADESVTLAKAQSEKAARASRAGAPVQPPGLGHGEVRGDGQRRAGQGVSARTGGRLPGRVVLRGGGVQGPGEGASQDAPGRHTGEEGQHA